MNKCADCNIEYDDSDLYRARNYNEDLIEICESCFDQYVYCEDCDVLVKNYVVTAYDKYICNHCFNNDYFSCVGCYRIYPAEDYEEEDYCNNCCAGDGDEDEENMPINQKILKTLLPFNADPLPSIKGIEKFNIIIKAEPKALLSGIEVEVASKDRNEGRLYAINKYKKIFNDYGALKHDGSIKNYDGYYNGFEIVSMPMLLQDHMDYEAWHELLKNDEELLYPYSGEYGAGIHIHLNRKAFDTLTLSHFIAFVHNNNNYNFIKTIAERELNNSRHSRIDEKNPFIHNYENYHDKYEAVRLNKQSTIELRIFNSILEPLSFWKNIEFTYALFEYCQVIKKEFKENDYRVFLAEKVNNYKSFVEWVADKEKKYPNLITFMKKKKILDEYKETFKVTINSRIKSKHNILEVV